MPPCRGRERANLPDSAFAYIDSSGRRSLPIHDEAHVRNALARFDRVSFEDDVARDRARTRLLRAAKRYGIVPVGFVTSELRPGRRLPKGRVALLMTDVVGSSALVAELGDRYPRLLGDLIRIVRTAVRKAGGHEVDARADEYFAAFVEPKAAVAAAVAIQAAIAAHPWPDGRSIRVRVGIHAGRPTATVTGYVGIAVNTVARVCAEAQGGQILVCGAARNLLDDDAVATLRVDLREAGTRSLRGIPEPIELWEVIAPR
jgi:class 3 adenylate cyclase